MAEYRLTSDKVVNQVDTDDCFEVVRCEVCGQFALLIYSGSRTDYKGNWPKVQLNCCAAWRVIEAVKKLQDTVE